MTPEQATEIRIHLTNELNRNGYSDIVNEVNTRLEENYDQDNFERSPTQLLIFFLSQSIDVLDTLSNKDYESLIKRFNELNVTGEPIEGISVELMSQEDIINFDLADLPNYNRIITVLREILTQIPQ